MTWRLVCRECGDHFEGEYTDALDWGTRHQNRNPDHEVENKRVVA